MAQEVFSVEQVAAKLGLHVRTFRNYVRDWRLRAVRIGKQYRIAADDLEGELAGACASLASLKREDAWVAAPERRSGELRACAAASEGRNRARVRPARVVHRRAWLARLG